MDQNMFMKVVLVLIVLFAIWQIIVYFNSTAEHMENVDVVDLMYSDYKPIPQVTAQDPSFYYKDDRYNTVKSLNKDDSADKLRNKWDATYGAGANQTCGDHLWNTTSPHNVMIDNCMGCNSYKESDVHEEPEGIMSDFSSQYDGTIGDDGLMKSDLILHDEFLPNELATGKKYGSCVNSGVVMPYQSCLQNKIYS